MTEPLLPPEVLADAPFTDEELAAFFVWADGAQFDQVLVPSLDNHGETIDGEAIDPGPAARWSIDGPKTAAWAMAKYAQLFAEVRELAEQRDEFIQRIVDWYAGQLGDRPRSLQFFGQHLEAYALARREETADKEKSQKFPSGKVSTTATAEKIEIDDTAAVLEWARTYAPTAIKEDLLKTPIYDATRIVEFPTRVVMHPCADIIDVPLHVPFVDREKIYELATGMECGSCGQEALVARWFETDKVVVGADGVEVLGLVIEPGKVTAKVTPS